MLKILYTVVKIYILKTGQIYLSKIVYKIKTYFPRMYLELKISLKLHHNFLCNLMLFK